MRTAVRRVKRYFFSRDFFAMTLQFYGCAPIWALSPLTPPMRERRIQSFRVAARHTGTRLGPLTSAEAKAVWSTVRTLYL